MNEELMHYSLELHDILWDASNEDIIKHNLPSCVYANIEAEDMDALVETETYRFLEDQFGFSADSILPKEIKVVEYGWVGERIIQQFPYKGSNNPCDTNTDEQKYAIIYEGVNVDDGDKKCFFAPNRKMAMDTMHSMVMNFLSTIPYDIDVSFRYQYDNPFCSINDGEYVWRCIPVSD